MLLILNKAALYTFIKHNIKPEEHLTDMQQKKKQNLFNFPFASLNVMK